MNNPDYQFVHPAFRFNGFSMNRQDMCRLSYNYSKGGAPYEKAIGEFIVDWFDNSSYITLQTSGTTGAPKRMQVNKQYMVNSARATGSFFNVHENCKALLCLPAQYIAGKMMLVRAFVLGWDLYSTEPNGNPLDNDSTIYDFAAMVPLQAQQSIHQLKQVKKLILGGAKVDSQLAMLFKNQPGEIYETYGMTETITHIASKRVGETAFTVLPGVTVTRDNRECLIIHAPAVNPEPVVTNDVVELHGSTQFIWLGRADNVVNSGGIKLFPEQIEEKLQPYIQNRFFTAGVPDETLGQKLILVIEGEPYEMKDEIFNLLEKYEKPKDIRFVPEFAVTESGKVQRSRIIADL